MNTYRVWFTIPENDYPMMETMQANSADMLAYHLNGTLNLVSVEPLAEWMN